MQISDILARKGTAVTSAQEDDTLATLSGCSPRSGSALWW